MSSDKNSFLTGRTCRTEVRRNWGLYWRGSLRVGRERKRTEEGWERFWWKKAVRRVGVAYRELIGSLYESWTIGIEKVYKLLIHTIIQQR